MRDPEQFDAFYKDARERLLVQTFALTGDLAASRRAVRDAFIMVWHHWRKNVRLDDPETIVRPYAWRLAQRRHTARIWHRDKGISPEVKEILEALGKLSDTQRKTLVLTQLASVSMPQMAREVGLPLETAERELQSGAAQLAIALDIATPALRSAFETVAASVGDSVRWPRTTIIRRAGSARRRTHTTIGAAAAVAVVVVSGAVVTNTTGARPTLDRAPVAGRPTQSTITAAPPPPPTVQLPTSSLLSAFGLSNAFDQRKWTVARTDDNGGGTGLVVPCQLDRYADPEGNAALVRVFEASATGKQESLGATQLIEISDRERAAARTFRTIANWFSGCTDERVQLLSTQTPEQVGDESVQLVLRSWRSPVSTYVVSVARTGLYTTAIVVEAEGDAKPDRKVGGALLGGAVNALCGLADGGACAPDKPDVVARTSLPIGTSPAMLAEIDLPPVSGVRRPWVGTEPRRATTNDAASACDETSFLGSYQGQELTNNDTRTFVVPEADLPEEFGLTETVASLPVKQAKAFVERIRTKVATCSERDLNTTVQQVEQREEGATSLTAWRLDIDVTDNRSVTFWMAIVRDGTSIAQVGFLPSGRAQMEAGAFVALAQRTLERLAELPAPRKAR